MIGDVGLSFAHFAQRIVASRERKNVMSRSLQLRYQMLADKPGGAGHKNANKGLLLRLSTCCAEFSLRRVLISKRIKSVRRIMIVISLWKAAIVPGL